MQHIHALASGWNIELESKPDFDQAMKRIYAWFEQQIIDRPPVRFTRHNAEFEATDGIWKEDWHNLRDKWLDEEYQLERFLTQVRGKRFLGETFPIYWPNLGPNVFASLYGCPLTFGEVTSWAEPVLASYKAPTTLNWEHEYLKKLESLTRLALEMCPGQFLVGYTDLHPGLDWLAAMRGTQQLALDLIDCPDELQAYLGLCTSDFLSLFDQFDAMLKAKGQPSASWMAIPSFGTMYIPSCDFAALISQRLFRQFALPTLQVEMRSMTHNIFHVDGKGVARHLDAILELPNLQAIQWVQGVGDDLPIMQWVPLIRRIQSAGKSVVVDLHMSELEGLIAAIKPEGVLLCLASDDEEEERAILKRIEKW
jgi:hypothetical protein